MPFFSQSGFVGYDGCSVCAVIAQRRHEEKTPGGSIAWVADGNWDLEIMQLGTSNLSNRVQNEQKLVVGQ